MRKLSPPVGLGIALVFTTSLILVAFGWWNLRLQRRLAQELVLASADRIGDVIRRSTNYQMMHNDRQAIARIIDDVGAEPGIRRIRIYNPTGQIAFSSEASELGSVVDMTAETCYACHTSEGVLTSIDRENRTRIVADPSGARYLGVIQPITNQPGCSSSPCHVHKADQRILGVIDTHLSLAGVDEQLAAHQTRLAGFTILALLLIAASSSLFLRMIRSRSAQLESMQLGLARSEKLASLGKLAATVAHEVNNPLFGILTYARLSLKELPDKPGQEKLADRLRTIERESQRCGEIVRNLLSFARPAPARSEAQSLTPLIDRALALVRHRIDLQRIHLKTAVASGLPPVVCDASQVEQALVAILVNAIEAMPDGGHLDLSVAASGDGVSIRIADTGPGIPQDVLPNIFEPFFTTKDSSHRTGLGLAVAHGIVKQHGGRIDVDSCPGEGTAFTLVLPGRQPDQKGAAA